MWYLEMGGNYRIEGKQVFGRKIYVQANQIEKTRLRFDNIDVFATVYQYDNTNQNEARLYGPMYIDLDSSIESETEFKSLKNDLTRIVTYLELYYGIDRKYIRFYFSGKKGFHLLLDAKLFNLAPRQDLNIIYKEIAKELSMITAKPVVDLKIYDRKRLLRLSNSINGKTKLYKVPISYEDIERFSLSEIKEYAKEKRYIEYETVHASLIAEKKINNIIEKLEKKKQPKKKKSITPVKDISKIKFAPCILKIYNEGASEGARNMTTIILASSMFQKGLEYDLVYQIMYKWNEEKNNPSLSESELKTTIDSAYQQINNGWRYGCSSINELGYCLSCRRR